MRIVIFCHSLLSDWNHGNAHFLRGVATELVSRGHQVRTFEPHNAWSRLNLVHDHGTVPLQRFRRVYPRLDTRVYSLQKLDVHDAVAGADLVIVHEWNEPELVAMLGQHRGRTGKYRLLFHDTHHRSVTAPREMARYDLRNYDGVLAFGSVIRDIYLARGWAQCAWTWHEAADTRVFMPTPGAAEGDVAWIGNWGDEERSEELREFLIEPIRRLRLRASVYGVRYPRSAIDELGRCGIQYRGYLPNFDAPQVMGRFRLTVHVPRRPYARALPGIPTIRPFEAMACGTPLISAPWQDSENLFTAGSDYLVAHDGNEMAEHMRRLLEEPRLALAQARRARRTIQARHSCTHRVNQLMTICRDLGLKAAEARRPPDLVEDRLRA
jgi:spore maturation protein CgeB